ncbi:MAG: hypothetical protein QXQ28_03240 [Candidatus Nezhaarchaeales archaeon]
MDCVIIIGRHRSFFKDRSITFTDDEGNVECVIPVPDEVILCDVYGNAILSDYVMLLILDGYVWILVCEECKRRYPPR